MVSLSGAYRKGCAKMEARIGNGLTPEEGRTCYAILVAQIKFRIEQDLCTSMREHGKDLKDMGVGKGDIASVAIKAYRDAIDEIEEDLKRRDAKKD